MAVKEPCCGPQRPAGSLDVTERDRLAPPADRQNGNSGARVDSASDRQLTHEAVQDYYGRVLQSSRDLKTSACTAGGKPTALLRQVCQANGRKHVRSRAESLVSAPHTVDDEMCL